MNDFVLPEWRQSEIAKEVCLIFLKNSDIKAGNMCSHLMRMHRVFPVPYSVLPAGKRRLLFREYGKYGFILPFPDGRFLFMYNNKQSDKELRKTVWHELGHILRGHKQDSQLAEAEADFFMKAAIVMETMLEKLQED
ncbi:MAG: ImmA/IrrE family metallo-endopeptidase [Treponemataceae bacterium]|nr:ImmA/IrrE family metallo-endopeptidase [Treponemataceae bacterium]